MDQAQECIVAPPVESGPSKLVSEGGTWCTWRLVQYNPHTKVLDSLQALGEVGTPGVLYHLAVGSIQKDQCIVQHLFS